MKLRVKPGPHPGLGRVDLNRDDSNAEYVVKGYTRPLKPTRIGRMGKPCLVFPLGSRLRVGDEVEVEQVLRCKMCGERVTVLINGMCERCYEYVVCGDMVAPPLAAALTAAGEGEGNRP